jgi:hypothetical protein
MLDAASKPGAAMRKALPGGRAPELPDLFSIGQYVRCVVSALPSSAGGGEEGSGEGGGKRAPRVGLSLRLRRLCEGLGPEALALGRCVPAVVRSVEDHVYTLGFGVKARRRAPRFAFPRAPPPPSARLPSLPCCPLPAARCPRRRGAALNPLCIHRQPKPNTVSRGARRA